MRALKIGSDKGIRPGNRPVNVTLRGKMDDGAHLVCGYHALNQRGVADIAFDKLDTARLFQGRKTGPIAGVGERIQHHQCVAGMRLCPVVNKVHSDKARATRHHQRLRHCYTPPCIASDPSMSRSASRQGRCATPKVATVPLASSAL